MTASSRPASGVLVVLVTAVLAALCLFGAGRADNGSPTFFLLSSLTAVIYIGVFFWFTPRSSTPRRAGDSTSGTRRDLLIGGVTGLGLLVVFIAGAFLVQGIPLLAEPVDDLLANSAQGALLPALAVTAVNGVAEEMFFRRTAPALLPGSTTTKVLVSLALYIAVSASLGVPLLLFAALVIGAAAHWLLHRGHGLLAPIVMHVVWSTGMALALPALLS